MDEGRRRVRKKSREERFYLLLFCEELLVLSSRLSSFERYLDLSSRSVSAFWVRKARRAESTKYEQINDTKAKAIHQVDFFLPMRLERRVGMCYSKLLVPSSWHEEALVA